MAGRQPRVPLLLAGLAMVLGVALLGGLMGPADRSATRATGAFPSSSAAAAPPASAEATTKATTTTARATARKRPATRAPAAAPAPARGGHGGPPVTGRDRFGIAAGCCLQYLSRAELARQLDAYKALGVRWLRFDLPWSGVQAGGRNSYNWVPHDNLVRAARSRGLRLLGMVGYTPAWARPPGCRGDDKCAPANVGDFAVFAGQAARRYGPRGVHAWEIWNEQNGSTFWKPAPDPSRYARMLRAAYRAIKRNDPRAWVVAGGMMPARSDGTDYAPADFLTALYRHGAKGSFDAVGAHPYCWAGSFDCPGSYAAWSAWSQLDRTRRSLRGVMVANGDGGKRIWGTEYGAPTAGGRQAVGEARQARQVADGYRLFAAKGWAGPLFWYSYRDACADAGDTECHFGLVRRDGSPKPALTAYRRLT